MNHVYHSVRGILTILGIILGSVGWQSWLNISKSMKNTTRNHRKTSSSVIKCIGGWGVLSLLDDPEPGNFFVFVSCVRCEAVWARGGEIFVGRPANRIWPPFVPCVRARGPLEPWFSFVFRWFSMIFDWFSMIFPWFSMIFRWFSIIF